MPAAMSFLDLDKLGAPDVSAEGVEDDSSRLVKQLTGWWKRQDGTLIHESDGKFAHLLDSGRLSGHVGSPEDLLRHLINLSRGDELRAYSSFGDAIPNPSLSFTLDELIKQLRTLVAGGNLGNKEHIRMARLEDLEAKKKEQEPGDDTSLQPVSTSKKSKQNFEEGIL